MANTAATRGTAEGRLRTLLLLLSATVFALTVIELILGNHTQEVWQLVPFALCGAGLAVVLLVLLRPTRSTLWLLRGVMAVVAFGTVLGMWQHFAGDLAFQREIRPNADNWTLIENAIHGAAPLLAPGILALGAGIALLATYGHPALQPVVEEPRLPAKPRVVPQAQGR